MPLFRALAKNMAPMTNADESPTNRLTLFPIYLSSVLTFKEISLNYGNLDLFKEIFKEMVFLRKF